MSSLSVAPVIRTYSLTSSYTGLLEGCHRVYLVCYSVEPRLSLLYLILLTASLVNIEQRNSGTVEQRRHASSHRNPLDRARYPLLISENDYNRIFMYYTSALLAARTLPSDLLSSKLGAAIMTNNSQYRRYSCSSAVQLLIVSVDVVA